MATSSDSSAAISSSRCRSHARIESLRAASPPRCPLIAHHARNSWAQRQAPYWCRHAKVNPSAAGRRSRPYEWRYEGLAYRDLPQFYFTWRTRTQSVAPDELFPGVSKRFEPALGNGFSGASTKPPEAGSNHRPRAAPLSAVMSMLMLREPFAVGGTYARSTFPSAEAAAVT